MHVYSGGDVQCKQAQRTNPTGHQYSGTKCTYKGPIVWAYGEEGHVEEADQFRDTEEFGEEAEPVLRRSTRNRRPPDRYGNPLSLPDVESDDGI